MRLRLIAFTLLALVLPATTQAALPPKTPPLEAAARVATWQIAHLSDLEGVRTFREDAAEQRGWINASFLIGLTALADATHDPLWSNAIERIGKQQGWLPGDRPRHADDDAIAQAWLWSALRSGDRTRLAPTRARLDAVVAAPSTVSLDFTKRAPGAPDPECQVRWCWADALFMAPPLYAQMSAATGDARYLAYADCEVQATNAALFDPVEQLYYRDTRYVAQRGPAGRKLFWSRGNGWAFAGLARFIAAMPAGSPVRARYVAQFRAMAARIVGLQGAQGYWPASLLDPSPVPETSGTAFFVYGLAWGVNAGVLDQRSTGAAIDRGWQALLRATDPDGRLHWVQQVGSAPDSVRAEDGELYGSGAFLLAASEIAKRERAGRNPDSAGHRRDRAVR